MFCVPEVRPQSVLWSLRTIVLSSLIELLHYYSFSSSCSQDIALVWGGTPPREVSPVTLSIWLGPYFPATNCLSPHPWASATFWDISNTSQAQLTLICLFLEVLIFLFDKVLFIQHTVTEVLQGNPPFHHLDSQKSVPGVGCSKRMPHPQM